VFRRVRAGEIRNRAASWRRGEVRIPLVAVRTSPNATRRSTDKGLGTQTEARVGPRNWPQRAEEMNMSENGNGKDIADPTPAFMVGLMLVAVVVGIILTIVFNGLVGFAAFGLTAVGFWKSSLSEIPATPPTVGILKFMGKPLAVLKDRGLRLIPLRGFIFGYDVIELDTSAQELEMKNITLTTPTDHIQTPGVKIAVTWRPDFDTAGSMLAYHDYSHGGHPQEISDFLEEIIVERVRQYANSPVEGPKTVEELVISTEGINHAILKTLGQDDLKPCSSAVPTEVLIDWYKYHTGSFRQSFREDWGDRWEGVEEVVTREGRDKIRAEVKERISKLNSVVRGGGNLRVKWLGIVIEKIAVDEIKEPAALATARLLQKQAQEQNNAEQTRLNALRERVAEYMGVPAKEVKLTREQAVTFVASGGKLADWKLSEERKTHEIGSGLAAVLDKLGLKVSVDASSGAKTGGVS